VTPPRRSRTPAGPAVSLGRAVVAGGFVAAAFTLLPAGLGSGIVFRLSRRVGPARHPTTTAALVGRHLHGRDGCPWPRRWRYVTGRLRVSPPRWTRAPLDEVYFRAPPMRAGVAFATVMCAARLALSRDRVGQRRPPHAQPCQLRQRQRHHCALPRSLFPGRLRVMTGGTGHQAAGVFASRPLPLAADRDVARRCCSLRERGHTELSGHDRQLNLAQKVGAAHWRALSPRPTARPDRRLEADAAAHRDRPCALASPCSPSAAGCQAISSLPCPRWVLRRHRGLCARDGR